MPDEKPPTEVIAAADSGGARPSVVPAVVGSTAKLMHGDVGRRQRRGGHPAKKYLAAFMPNRAVSTTTMQIIIVVEIVLALVIWIQSPFKVLPRPMEVYDALGDLWTKQGLGNELISSFMLNLEALFWSTIISLGLAYLTVLPAMRPIVLAISKGRFLSLAGFTFIFTLVFAGGHELKLSLLVFAVTVFYVTSMASVIASIPKGDFDHARTLRMREWRVVWEVVILGTVDKAFEVLRQNAAMGWMMLTMVEGIVRSEGGIGKMLLDENKHFKLPAVFAVQLVILLVGMSQDFLIGGLRHMFCPYADLKLERK